MPLGQGNRASQLPSTTGWLARMAYQRARAAGLKLDPLLRQAGLTQQQLRDPTSRMAVRDQVRFVNLVGDAIGDDCLGFNLAADFDPREIGLYYYVLASSDNVSDALQRGARYTAIVNEGVTQTLTTGKQITLAFHYVGVSRHLDRHQIEFWMAAMIRAFRRFTGRRIVPARVRLTHRRRDCPPEVTGILGNNIEFSAPADDISFDKRVGQLRFVGADRHLNKLLLRYCEEALSRRRGGRPSLRSSVENALVPLLPHGKARASEVARELGVSPRTLARRLASEDLTFSGVLQRLRSDLSRRYLAEDKLSISQIAWLLGYREIGAFSHAFKRQTGKTPREFRAQIR